MPGFEGYSIPVKWTKNVLIKGGYLRYILIRVEERKCDMLQKKRRDIQFYGRIITKIIPRASESNI